MKTNPERSARPAGFNRPAQKKKHAPQTEEAAQPKKRKTAREKAHDRAVKRAQRDEKRAALRAEKAQKRALRTPEQKRKRLMRIMAVIIAVVLLGLTAIIIFGDHTKTVHQMPTILRESSEETEEGA